MKLMYLKTIFNINDIVLNVFVRSQCICTRVKQHLI